MSMRTQWTTEKVIEEIGALRSKGITPSQKYVVKNYPALYGAASRYCGSWRKALIAAGENPKQVAAESIRSSSLNRTKWTREAIIRVLGEKAAEGIPLNVTALRRAGLAALHKAAITRFGSYEKALEHAGIDYAEVRAIRSLRDWRKNPSKIVEAIQSLHRKGCDLNVSSAQFHDSSLVTMAYEAFGSWDAALRRAGFDPLRIRLDVNTESHKGRIFQNICHEILSKLRPHWKRGFKFTRGRFTAYPDLHDASLGTWIDLKLAAYGESVNTSIKKYSPYAPRLLFIYLEGRRKSTRGVTFRSIFEFEAEANTPSLRGLFERLRELKTYKAPGTSFERWSRVWSKRQVIDFIRSLKADSLSSRQAQLHHKREYAAACRLFGGWYQAVAKSGIDPATARRQFPTYSRKDIDAFIQERISAKAPLSAKAICASPDGNGKYQAAKRLYGGWAAALKANGLTYGRIREKPGREKFTKAMLDRFIKERWRRREHLSAMFIRDNFRQYYSVAHRSYGGWRSAVEANDIPYDEVSINKLRKDITKEALDGFIRSRWRQDQPLNAKAVCSHNRPMYTAACRRHYGSWKKAIEANGISYGAVAKRNRRQ